MVFWASVLVFIASIMTYMFFPRNDQYDQELRKAEYAITSFVNQHQALRDYMYQMIEWHPSDSMKANSKFFNLIPFDGLQSMLPWGMRRLTSDGQFSHDIYAICSEGNAGSCETKLTPNPLVADSVGHYTSVLVCLNNDLNSITDCPSGKQYLLTYGYPPNMFDETDWWRSRTTRLDTWRKAILRRTRGSASCGVLYAVGGYGADDHYYSIDTTQRLTGVVRRPDIVGDEVQYVVPTPITENMAHSTETGNVGLNTCGSESACTNKLTGILFCLSPFNNPYDTDGLAFMIDKINNTGYGSSSSGNAIPLKGVLSYDILSPDSGSFSETTYTISGILQDTGTNGQQNILLGNVPVSFQCSGSTGARNCSVTVDGLTSTTTGGNLLSFTYIGTGSYQKLYVNGVSTIRNTAAKTLADPKLANVVLVSNSNNTLKHLRIYRRALTETQIENNYRADKKRFGI